MYKDDVILQLYSRAAAPNRDYYGLTITYEEVILNTWNITHGPHVYPKKIRCALEDLQFSKQILGEIHRLFGFHVVEYCLALSTHTLKLQCLPNRAFLRILKFLATNDILHLGQTSKIFLELCNRNAIWKLIFGKRLKQNATREELKQGELKGWRYILRNKLSWIERKNLNYIARSPIVLGKSERNRKLPKEPTNKKQSPIIEVHVKKLENPNKSLNGVSNKPEFERLYNYEESIQKKPMKIFVSNSSVDIKKRYSSSGQKTVPKPLVQSILLKEDNTKSDPSRKSHEKIIQVERLKSQSHMTLGNLEGYAKPLKGILKKPTASKNRQSSSAKADEHLNNYCDVNAEDISTKFREIMSTIKDTDIPRVSKELRPQNIKNYQNVRDRTNQNGNCAISNIEDLSTFLESNKKCTNFDVNNAKVQGKKKLQDKTFFNSGSQFGLGQRNYNAIGTVTPKNDMILKKLEAKKALLRK